MSLASRTPTLSVAEASLLAGTAKPPRRHRLHMAIMRALQGAKR